MTDDTQRELTRQTQAAKDLVRDLATDDAQLAHDMIEGETDLFEAIEAALAEITECDVMAAGLKDHIERMKSRLSSVERRADYVRGLIDQAFQVAEVKSHRFATATISQKRVPPKLIVSDESQIPSRFFAPQPPKLDRKALTDAVKSGDVPGASMSNGGTTIQIRR